MFADNIAKFGLSLAIFAFSSVLIIQYLLYNYRNINIMPGTSKAQKDIDLYEFDDEDEEKGDTSSITSEGIKESYLYGGEEVNPNIRAAATHVPENKKKGDEFEIPELKPNISDINQYPMSRVISTGVEKKSIPPERVSVIAHRLDRLRERSVVFFSFAPTTTLNSDDDSIHSKELLLSQGIHTESDRIASSDMMTQSPMHLEETVNTIHSEQEKNIVKNTDFIAAHDNEYHEKTDTDNDKKYNMNDDCEENTWYVEEPSEDVATAIKVNPRAAVHSNRVFTAPKLYTKEKSRRSHSPTFDSPSIDSHENIWMKETECEYESKTAEILPSAASSVTPTACQDESSLPDREGEGEGEGAEKTEGSKKES